MPRFQPPNSLLFLITLFRPHLLRPDIRVPNIGHVDYAALRKIGFNAVVIDKDNCLTLPERDQLYPPLRTAWAELLSVFDPGRVLVVSNSAGTKKDPGGLAAESVTHQLRTPVLLHPTPKPACSSLILQYFRGEIASPRPTLASDIKKRTERLAQEEWDDKDAFVRMFTPLAEGKICGPNTRKEGAGIGGLELTDPISAPDESKSEDGKSGENVKINAAKESIKIEAGEAPTTTSSTAKGNPADSPNIQSPISNQTSSTVSDQLRILVIGDRLFTDTLLANRLRATLGPENVISIQTTLLPDPTDVRFLRWIEDKMSRGRLRVGREDWGRFVIRDNSIEESAAIADRSLGWKRFIPFRKQWIGAPDLGWRWSTWSFWGLIRGGWRGTVRVGRGVGSGSKWVWVRLRSLIQEQQAKRKATSASALEGQSGSEVNLLAQPKVGPVATAP